MKKKHLGLFIAAGLLFLSLLSGILIYSFRPREQEGNGKQGQEEALITAPDVAENSESIRTPDGKTSDYAADFSASEPVENPPDQITPASTPAATPAADPTANPTPIPREPIVLAFAGDINLDEDSKPVARYDRQGQGILGCISPDLVEEMTSADIMMLNNEFAYSLRGEEEKNKSYTFRAAPKRVEILKEMGVDIVSLANNHALDFGEEALLDTFTTLEEAEIDYVGAGINLERAKAPIYYTLSDKKIAYVAASRVIFAMDWYATDTRPGMIGTYDPSLLLEVIREAKEQSDFVVVYVHWGVERTHYPTDYQKSLARKYIDAGADAVIGCHPHVLQGLEFYQGRPIAYSLGNYWFNNTTREAGLLKIILPPEGGLQVQLLPTLGENTYTSLITDRDKREAYFDFMEKISFGVSFDEEGYASEVNAGDR